MSRTLFDIQGRRGIVTGAGANGGIGHALALGLADAGATLMLCDIDRVGLERTRGEIAARGRPVDAVPCDIADEQQVDALFEQAGRVLGAIDFVVNVPFAFPSRVPPHELALADWQRTLEVSLTGYFLCCRAAVRVMRGRGGVIVNVGSNAGCSALGRGALPYASAKAGVHQLTRELAIEYAADGIRVNAIVPAQTLTPGLSGHLERPEFRDRVLPRILRGLPGGRLLEPAEMVGPVLFLLSDAASAVNGALLPVDGGNLALNAGGG